MCGFETECAHLTVPAKLTIPEKVYQGTVPLNIVDGSQGRGEGWYLVYIVYISAILPPPLKKKELKRRLKDKRATRASEKFA